MSNRQRINGGKLPHFLFQVRSVALPSITYEYPDPTKTLGIDLHQYSGVNVDWKKAKQNGINFALIKCMNGVNLSPNFHNLWDGAREAGILRGAWTWLYPASVVSPGRQAREFVKHLGEDKGELPVAVDYEWTKSGGKKANPTQLDLWGEVKPLEDLLGRKPIIYSAPGYVNSYKLSSIFAEYDLWIANYKVSSPMIPPPFTKWTFWQWTESGRGEDYGVDKYSERAVDLNYFNGSVDDLYEYAKRTPKTVPAGEPRFLDWYNSTEHPSEPIQLAQQAWLAGRRELLSAMKTGTE